jgi:hypothetical protein
MKPESIRLKSKVFSVSLPLEVIPLIMRGAEGLNMRFSHYLAVLIMQGIGADPSILRGPGNPRRREPDLYDQIKAKMGEMAPSRKDIIGMFGGDNSVI